MGQGLSVETGTGPEGWGFELLLGDWVVVGEDVSVAVGLVLAAACFDVVFGCGVQSLRFVMSHFQNSPCLRTFRVLPVIF